MSDELYHELRDLLRKAGHAEPPPPPDAVATVAAIIARAASEKPVTASDMGQKPRWDPTITLGHAITMATFILGLLGMLWHFSTSQANILKDIDNANLRAQRYIPLIESASKINDIQETRISNLADTVIEIRRQNAETSTLLGTIREDLATIRTRLSIDRPPPR